MPGPHYFTPREGVERCPSLYLFCSMSSAASNAVMVPDVRVRGFVDYWNFQLSMKRWDENFSLDWKAFGPWLANHAGSLGLEQGQHGRIRYEGLHVYASFNPKNPHDGKFRSWALNTLDRHTQTAPPVARSWSESGAHMKIHEKSRSPAWRRGF